MPSRRFLLLILKSHPISVANINPKEHEICQTVEIEANILFSVTYIHRCGTNEQVRNLKLEKFIKGF